MARHLPAPGGLGRTDVRYASAVRLGDNPMKKKCRGCPVAALPDEARSGGRVEGTARKRPLARILCGFLGAATLLCGSIPALAIDPSTPLIDLSGQTWVLENGLPQNTVQALAQSTQGYVWVGTESGVARFDGRDFQIIGRGSATVLANSDIDALLAARDGALWIGTEQGLARWQNGSITTFSTQNGMPSGQIRGLTQAGDGTIWVWSSDGLARFDAGRFEMASQDGLPPGEITALLAQQDGTLWVLRPHGADVYKNGRWTTMSWQSSWPQDGIFLARQLPDGTMALAGHRDLVITRGGRVLTRLTVGKELQGARIQALLADREGALWIGTNNGLARFAAGKLQMFPAGDPLGSASVLALLEDREGDLWVGTETNGLHILRDRRFFSFSMREGLISNATTTAVEDAAGTLWVGTKESGLNAVPLRKAGTGSTLFPAPATIRTYTVRSGLASDVILSLAAAPDGDLWLGTPDGLSRMHQGRIDTYTLSDGLPDDFIRSLLVDMDGSLWIGTRHGLAHRTTGPGGQIQIKTYTQASGLGSDLVGAMARDAHGDLWVATLAGLSRLRDGTITNFTTADGLSSDVATALLPRGDGTLLIGTENHGLDRWDGHRFSRVLHGSLEKTTIHAILDDGKGHLWFATGNGIARCDEAARGDDEACSHWIEFGTAEGLRTQQMAANSHPSAWRGHDGNLWFATAAGLVEVDPAHFSLDTLPPPVVLERFAVDNVDQPLRSTRRGLRVPAGHVNFEFDYAGLSFIAPQEVRYRYMLQGFDRGWTDAGPRRAAYYTNIPPGQYVFRVQAANRDGYWNEAGAQFSFTLQRHFYQTLWFYGLLLVAVAAGILLLLRLRLRVAEVEFRAVLRERSRIAREIHDTLAQGYVGVSVHLELIAELLRRKKLQEAATQLDATREYVREGLADARQSIWALRTQDSGDETLPVKLRRMTDQAADAELKSQFKLFGTFRSLPAATERELLRVAQEAIHNVKKHAAAHELLVQLEYDQETIMLEVRDDGSGGAVRHKPGFASGHFGITGMQERVEAIGGTFAIESAPGMGTTVSVRLPDTASTPKPGKVLQ